MIQNNDKQNSNHSAAAGPQPCKATEKSLRPALAVAHTRGQRWERYAVGVLFSVIWSSAFIAGKMTVMEMGPFATLFYRFVLTVLVLLPLCGKKLMGPKGKQAILAGILLGLLNNVAYLGLNFSALQRLPPSWVVIVVSCAPFMTMTLAALRGQESFDKEKLLGFAIAFTGVVIMVGITGLHAGAILGLVMTVGATLAFSAGAVLFRGKYDDLPLLPVNFWMSVCAMLCFAPAAFTDATPLQLTWPAQIALIWLVVVSLTGMALWLLLIRTQGPSMAASYNLLNPLSGLALSALILGTDIGVQDAAGATAIVAGLYVALRPRQIKKLA
ncbi:MAG: DMT family transporter [Desulfovibrio sp.]|uniref:DMT family transporter n=1 Tax=Desulfovibrio sp. TaxID=885 RepID=UPI0039E67465